jgi:light-regulated signal transduction histidine kinase (bacteriophytochrome)
MGCAAEGPLPAGLQAVVGDALRREQVVQAELEDQHGRTWWFAAVRPPGERYVNLYGRDVTERKRAEEAVRRAAEELARSNRELEQFAYVASHDLQEPLRVVGGYLQLIQRRYKDRIDADANDFIDFAVDGAARMQQLISDLLDYSRVGTQGKPFVPTDLEAVLDKALAHLQTAIDESGAAITRDPLPTIDADESQWVRLLQNLIGNAIKYCGPRRPEIHVSARQDDSRWTFSVRDNGIGIEPQYWEKIFAIFQRLHTRQKYPGTGIGLAICKRIVERHGGRIWLESQPGQGTTFYWTLGT